MIQLLSAVLLAVCASASSSESLESAAALARAAQGPITVARVSPDGEPLDAREVSREKALDAFYSRLAADQYGKARATLTGDELAKAEEAGRKMADQSEQALKDAQAASIDPDLLKKSGHTVCSGSWPNQQCYWVCDCNAVMAVRGGRALDDSLNKTLTGLELQMTGRGSRGFMPRSTAAYQASPYLETARVYEQMAAATEGKLPAASPELSPKEIYAEDAPAVVVIVASDKDGQGELGTGSILTSEGRVLTNAHVVTRDSTGQPYAQVRYYLKPAKLSGDPKRDLVEPHMARVAKFDRALDLAVLEPEEPLKDAPTIELGDSDAVSPGDRVVAIGHPEQGGLWTLTQGVVSTIIADLGGIAGKDAFQTDASINRGNSGGPLLDRAGRQIGVNTSMARKAADGLTITSVNFSLKSGVVKSFLGGESVVAKAEPAVPAQAEGTLAPVAKPAVKTETIVAQAPKTAAPSKPEILTEKKPYRIDDIMQAEQEMDDMGKDMHEEIMKRASQFSH